MQTLDSQKPQNEKLDSFQGKPMDPLIQRLDQRELEPEEVDGFEEAFLVGAKYDGGRMVAALKFYDPKEKKIYIWRDHSGHLPYCFAKLSPDEVKLNSRVVEHPGFKGLESVTKFNAMIDKEESYTKIIAKDPLSIGGRIDSIREFLPAWEARIQYHESYLYDAQLIPGVPYSLEEGKIERLREGFPAEVEQEIENLFKEEPGEMQEFALEWARLLEQEVPRFRRAAIDIEVFSPVANRIPDPEEAPYQVVCVSIVDSGGEKRVLLLRRENVEEGDESVLGGLEPEYYDSEEELILETFWALLEYPFILTFNGDQFDLKYLFNRALKLGFPREKIPMTIGRDSITLTYGVHLDLYRFFFNKSIQVYAFGQRYRELTLDEVSKALLNSGKIVLERPFSELSYAELASYCLRDSELTLSLSAMNNDLLMRLITLVARIGRMPFEDVVREGVSNWIRNLMYYEHRRRNWVIPRPEDISELKGVSATEAIIKGKKYKGAIVIEPTPGVHFGVSVLDFASLYPSIIKQYNLSYETILCPHKECRSNTIPGTPHWVCRLHRGLSSLIIGSLRDLRVKWYKKRAKDPNLTGEQREFLNVVQLTLKVFLNASLDYEEPMVLVDDKGQLRILKIGEFVERSLVQNGAILGPEGAEISKPLDGWKALSFDRRTGKMVFSPIRSAIRHPYDLQYLIQIRTDSGRVIRVTPCHSLFTLDKSTYQVLPVEADDLTEGKHIIVPIRSPAPEIQSEEHLNLIEQMTKLPRDIRKRIRISVQKRPHKKRLRSLLRILGVLSTGDSTLDQLALKLRLEKRTIRSGIGHLVSRGCVEEKQPINESLSRLWYGITTRGQDYLRLESRLILAFRYVRGRHGTRWYASLEDIIPVKDLLSQEELKEWRVVSFHSAHAIPALLPLRLLFRLMGFYVSEGSARIQRSKIGSGQSCRLTFSNSLPEILREIEILTQNIFDIVAETGDDSVTINSEIVYYLFAEILHLGENAYEKRLPEILFSMPEEYKWEFLHTYFRGDGNSDHNTAAKFTTVSISLANQLLLLLAQLGLKGVSVKREGRFYRIYVRDSAVSFADISDKGLRYNYSVVIPREFLANESSILNIRMKKSVKREKLASVLRDKGIESLDNRLQDLYSFALGDLALDRISSVEYVKPMRPYVYDLSVEDAENFVAGFGWILAHNSYGVFGAEHFPLYCLSVADSTAAIGRYAINETIEEAKSLGIEVIYGDTDSVFLSQPREDQINDLLEWSKNSLRMELEVDKQYRYVAFSTRKKNYFGVFQDGSVDIKGLTGKKRNTPVFLKKAFYDAIDALSEVENQGDFKRAKEKIKSIVQECYIKLKKRQFSLEDLSISIMLGKPVKAYEKTTPQHVKAALLLAEKGQEVKPGDIIGFVKTSDSLGVKPVELAKVQDVDTEKYTEYVKSTFEQVFDALGLEFGEVAGVTKLEDFLL